MKKIIITYGVISGVIVIGSMLIGMNMASGSDSGDFSAWMGYLFMIAALTLVFIGIKRHRDQELGGVIKFKTAFLVGLGITVVASFIYVALWEVNLAITDYAFIEQYTSAVIEAKEAEGLSGAEMDSFRAEMAQMVEDYANPLYRLPWTFIEIFPVGLLISLISAALLRKSSFMPAA